MAFFHKARVLWVANRAISDATLDLNIRDYRIADRALNPPWPGALDFNQLAYLYRRRSPRSAAYRVLIEVAAVWKAIIGEAVQEVSQEDAETYFCIVRNAAAAIASRLWPDELACAKLVDDDVEARYLEDRKWRGSQESIQV